MIAYLFMALGAATLLATGVAGCEHKAKKRAQAQTEAARAETRQVQAEFDLFVSSVAKAGKEREAENARIVEQWRLTLKERSSAYEKRLADLRNERDVVQRVLDEWASRDPGAGPGGMSSVPDASGAPRPGGPDLVPRAALERLARDAQETTLMFEECRDSWKAVVSGVKHGPEIRQ